MATKSNYNEEIGLLRRAVAEPVTQLIVVEFDLLPRLHHTLHDLVALNPKRAHVIHKFDFRKDTAAGLIQTTAAKLSTFKGSRPALLALVGPGDIEADADAPASQRFWKEMNLAREAWHALDVQLLLCVERWSYRQALAYADHLLSWAAMRIHLIGGIERPMMTDRSALASGLFGDRTFSPEVARERWQELEQSYRKALERSESPTSFPQHFFIPMLEAALSLGDLVLARRTRELAQEKAEFRDQDMPRWHELNLALALAEHDDECADEHAHQLLKLANDHPDERVRERALIAVNNQAQLLADTAHFAIAEPLFRKSLELAEKMYGPESPDRPRVAIHLNNLAVLLQDTNRLAEAEPLIRRALAIDEKSFGPEHPEVATDLNNLAQLLQATGRLAEAELLSRRALAIDEQHFGPKHPNVAIDLDNLAQLLQATNRLAEAEPLTRRALAIDEQSYGPEHPNIATRLNNLAQLLQETNRLTEAEPLMRRALAIDEQSYGPEHPKVAIRLNNLAQLLKATNRLTEAEPLMRRTLAIDEQSYGPEHPKVAIRLNNLAQLLKATNRLTEAEPLMRKSAGIFIRSLGAEHPNTKGVLGNYKAMLSAMKLPEAEIQVQMQSLIGGKS